MGRPHRVPWVRLAAAVAAAALAPAASCGDPPPDPMDDPACRALLADPDSLDAFDWLKTAPLTKKPGGMTTDEALALAHTFEAAGATRLTAVRVREAESPGWKGETSAGMVVALPDDPPRRKALFRLYAKLLDQHGEAPRADTGQHYLYVPWAPAAPAP